MNGEVRRTEGVYEDSGMLDEDGQKLTVWRRGLTEVMCCGEWLECTRFTNTCGNCNADYNMSGHMLAPREQWGEDTGESILDILWADCDNKHED